MGDLNFMRKLCKITLCSLARAIRLVASRCHVFRALSFSTKLLVERVSMFWTLTTRNNVVSFLRWLEGRVEILKGFCITKSDKHVYKTRVNWLWRRAFSQFSLPFCLRSRNRFSDVTKKWVTNLIQFHGTLRLKKKSECFWNGNEMNWKIELSVSFIE